MRIDVFTIFPGMVSGFAAEALLGKAQERGLLDVRAHSVTDEMKLAAAVAIASVISDEELHPDYIIPSVFNRKVAPAVATAVGEAAIQAGVARKSQEVSSS